jgi:hypothetical protein
MGFCPNYVQISAKRSFKYQAEHKAYGRTGYKLVKFYSHARADSGFPVFIEKDLYLFYTRKI